MSAGCIDFAPVFSVSTGLYPEPPICDPYTHLMHPSPAAGFPFRRLFSLLPSLSSVPLSSPFFALLRPFLSPLPLPLPSLSLATKQIFEGVMGLIERERNGEKVNTQLIRNITDCFVALGLDDDDDPEGSAITGQLSIYKKYFEESFLQRTEEYASLMSSLTSSLTSSLWCSLLRPSPWWSHGNLVNLLAVGRSRIYQL